MQSGSLVVIFFRSLIILLYLIVAFRFIGKRQLGQMNIYDLAMIMLVANAVQNSLTEGSGKLSVGLVSAATLIIAGRFLTQLIHRSKRFQERLVGTPTILIHNGRMLKDRMARELVSEEQLMAALRTHGLVDPRDAKLAVLEIDGTLSVVPRQRERG